MAMVVRHKSLGQGTVRSIEGGIIEVQFGGQIKKFQFPKAFGQFLETNDADLITRVEHEKMQEKLKQDKVVAQKSVVTYTEPSRPVVKSQTRSFSVPFGRAVHNSLVGDRAQTITVCSEEEMFEIIGYMAAPGRVSSIEAEVPKDGRDKIFEEMFPGQTYRPITMDETPSGMPNKLSAQFRINFSNLRNCPDALKKNMGKGNSSCVGRINKSKFVIDVVKNYGFKFGDRQNVSAIRSIAEKRGYLEAFENGYKR